VKSGAVAAVIVTVTVEEVEAALLASPP
jgi:hypothetical protein